MRYLLPLALLLTACGAESTGDFGPNCQWTSGAGNVAGARCAVSEVDDPAYDVWTCYAPHTGGLLWHLYHSTGLYGDQDGGFYRTLALCEAAAF